MANLISMPLDVSTGRTPKWQRQTQKHAEGRDILSCAHDEAKSQFENIRATKLERHLMIA